MDGARLSRFPHLSWFSIPLRAPLERGLWATTYEGHVHAIHLTRHGSYDTRWITRGRERAWRATAGQVHFAPADGETHTILVRDPSAFESITFLLPRGHIATISAEEAVRSGGAVRQVLVADDRLLQSCMIRLSTPDDRDDNQDRHKDEWARRFVLRLNELTLGGTPDWHDDASVFDSRTLHGLVAHIDAHLRVGPTLADMALQVGMSPSHFGRKFRQTTGLSLYRFVNRRRIVRSLDELRYGSEPVAALSCDLGFSSQSHFTRVFSDLTGMTPAKYRKQYQRTVA